MSQAPAPGPLPLSEAQRRAVGHPLADALVTAGAGSGKTRVLTARFAHLVREHGLGVRRVAALTFTEKAAAELRERAAQLFGAGEEETRAGVEFAPISTLHAFFAALLRLHAVEAGLDPAFQVLDERAAGLLEAEARDLVCRRLAREEPDLLAALEHLGEDPGATLAAALRLLRGAGVPAARLSLCAGPEAPGPPPAELAALAAAFEEEGAAAGLTADPALRDRFAEALAGARRAAAALGAGEPEAAFDLFEAADRLGAPGWPRRRALGAARKALGEALSAAAERALDAWAGRRVLPALQRGVVLLDETFRSLRRERGGLDFADLEIEALALLEAADAGGAPPDLVPAALLVDEYQDTNPLQARILAHLRTRAPHFAVGDPKQGIYRFRRADVGVILAERERVGPAGRHALAESYRAHPALVDVVNEVFERLFAGGAAGVPYEPLVARGAYAPAPEPLAEVVAVDGGAEAPLDAVRVEEAEWIAGRIRDLVASGTPCLAQAAGGRPLRYGDVAVLVRARGPLDAIEEALARHGVPFVTHGGSGFFTAAEITDLVHALRAIHDPEDRHALAALLAGPLCGADEAQLARWFDPEGEGTPRERLARDAASDRRLAELLHALTALAERAVLDDPAGVVRALLYDLGLFEAVLLEPQGPRRAANLRKALWVAEGLTEQGARGLGGLLRLLETLRDGEAREPQAPAAGEEVDAVQVLTVHGAKGLEFPVVFLADAGRRPGRSAQPPLLHDGAGGLGVTVRDPFEGRRRAGAGHRRLDALERAAAAEESLRLLYVALTRAKERVYVTFSHAGYIKSGLPARAEGWARALWELLGGAPGPGPEVRPLGAATLVLRALARPPQARPAPPPATLEGPPDPAADREAEARVGRACRPTAPLGGTRFVVGVSELMRFAAGPARLYHERLVPADLAAVPGPPPALPEDAEPDAGESELLASRREGREAFDEPAPAAPEGGGASAAARGRAVHRLIEQLGPDLAPPTPAALRAALAAELEGAEPAAADLALCATLVGRFLATPTAAALGAALRRGHGVARELAFHAAVRFPHGARVGGFEALLVKGSIDLLLDGPDGLWIVDHKTNARGPGAADPAALAGRYGWQLALYALAVERLHGRDVAGARLLLLHPSWGAEAVEVPVDVSGARLGEARRLCQAFAVAELEGRWPERFEDLLAGPPAG